MMSAVRCRSTILKMTTYSVNAMDKKESKDVYSALHELGIPFTEIMHEPVFPVSDAQTLEPNFLWQFVVLSGTFHSVLNIF